MFAASKTASVTSGYQISRSLRFNASDTTYCIRTPAGAGNRTTWTWSQWFKISTVGTEIHLFGASTDHCYIKPDSTLSFNTGPTVRRITTQVFRDVGAWMHLVVVWDSSNATANDRLRIYINGVQVTAFSTNNTVTQNDLSGINSVTAHNIGRFYGGSDYFNGYMTEINFIDGQALTASSFGETNAQTGVWQPKAYSGSYGTNGFYLNFSDNSNTTAATLGKDYSGNGNNWTPNNFSVTAGAGNDSLVDVPTPYGVDTGVGGSVGGNYGTWNPLTFYSTGTIATFTNGNLDVSVPASAGLPIALGTFVMPSGKWYWEVTITSGGAQMVGIADSTAGGANSSYTTANGWYYYSGGQKYNNNVPVSYGTTFTVGDVIGIALDIDAGTLVFYKNGASQGTAYSTGLTGKTFVAALGNGSGGVAQGYTGNFGQRAFANTAPSGFQALCTQNLPTPTIGATSATLANKYFDVSTWSGTGSNISVTNSGSFQPDWVWAKSRSNAGTNNILVDAVRGINYWLASDSTSNESTLGSPSPITAFNSNGFSGDTSISGSGRTYVGWQWKANGAGSSNTAGSITSTVSANTTSGFSIVTWAGPNNNTTSTVGHGLGVVPSVVFYKARTSGTANWTVYFGPLSNSASNVLYLNLTSALNNDTNVFNNTAPTSTVLTVKNVEVNGASMVAYCFAAIAGYSAFGFYTGNGSADGPFVYTGFRPAFVMVKTSSVATQDWYILDSARDTYNLTANKLFPNSSNAENAAPNNSTSNALDFLSNGFKLKTTNDGTNQNAGTYIYMAFASSPFKYSLAR